MIEKDKKPKITKSEFKNRIEALKERDSEMVTGIFKNLEQPGGSVSFNLKLYDGDDFSHEYTFFDNERYTIPRGVARHLNNNCAYKAYKYLPGESGDKGVIAAHNDGSLKGAPNMTETRKVQRFAFQSLEYMDEDPEMYPSGLSEVTINPVSVQKSL
jgi:hypothetical protein